MNEWFRLELYLVNKHLKSEIMFSKKLTLKENIDLYLTLTNNSLAHYLLIRSKDNQILDIQAVLVDLRLIEGEELDIYPYD